MLPVLSTILVGFTASVVALQSAPPPTGVPATTSPPKERIRPPNEIYKPSKQDSRNPDQWEPPAQPKKPGDKDAPPAAQPGQPAQPAGQPGAQPPAPAPGDVADGDSTSAAAANAAGAGPVAVVAAPPKPLPAASSQDLTVILVVAGCIFLPLVLGMWWVFKDGVRDRSHDISSF